MKRLLSALLIFISAYSYATHNRAGEIIYTRVAPFSESVGGVEVPVYTYSITLIKYTDDGANIADRCADTLYFGDGTREVVDRINGPVGSNCQCSSTDRCGDIIINDQGYRVKKNIYRIRGSGVHRYSSTGSYLIRNSDPNRNAGVANIPNSVDQPFYVESYLQINTFTGPNSSPEFHFDPIDRACLGKCFTHNPGAFDPDGDSLSYVLTMCRGAGGNIISGYSYPSAGSPGIFEIHPTKGLLTWCSPQAVAEYNIAFIVQEWRKNTSGVFQMIGYVIRDMQVIVDICNNDPPQIIVPADTCVEAGTLIKRKILVKDPDVGDTVILDGEGGGFAGPNPIATLSPLSGVVTSSITQIAFYSDFIWQTTCDHVRQQAYQTNFKAKDVKYPAAAEMATFNSFNIKVVPPSVKNVTAAPIGSTIKVSWSLSSCSPANNPLIGYQIYRKNDCTPFIPVPCQTGVPASSGFIFIAQTGAASSFHIDDNNGNGLVVGQNYSYLVVATYSDGIQSYASSQVCVKLKRDIPLLLNVDVTATSETGGSIKVMWTKPLISAGNLDTLTLPGPYNFTVKYRTAGTQNAFTTIASTPLRQYYLSLIAQNDTQYVHTGLNTVANAYEYQIGFTAGTVTVGNSQVASSVFLTALSGDRKIHLQWTSKTPWDNKKYTIWRKDPGASLFNPIDSTANTYYSDSSAGSNVIVNRHSYCYRVRSEGEYSDPTIYKPLLNKSEEVCATAKDLTPPCTPTLTVNADCPTGFVHVSWTNIKLLSCGDDVTKYILYYRPTIDAEYTIILQDTISPFLLNYTYDGLTVIAGCYAIQAADSSNNISPRSPDFCIDNCPIFELPNVFSPNNDNANDFFQAIKDRVRQIKSIDMSVFDRWGNLVYKTTDPYFKWDGVSIITKQPVSEGTLFYICDVFEPRLKGIVKRNLKGYVELVR